MVNGQSEFLYYYHPDHLGSTGFVTDANGELYEHMEYFPFGETWVQEHSNTQRMPYLYTGKELDEETGLYYYGARYYDPRTSVWQSADPILGAYLSAGLNGGVQNPINLTLYAYAYNNPMKFNDPDGRSPEDQGSLNAEMHSVGTVQETWESIKTWRSTPTWYGRLVEDSRKGAELRAAAAQAAVANGEISQEQEDAYNAFHANAAYATEVVPLKTNGEVAEIGVTVLVGGGLARGVAVTKGLTTPKKYFGNKTKPEVKDALEKKYGPPKSSREHADTYYNDKTKRSYNVHEEPGHYDGKPHVDIRRRGGYEERKYDLKEGE